VCPHQSDATQSDAKSDEVFKRLELLHAQLPAMQQKGNELGLAREARRLQKLKSNLDILEREWERLNTECKDLMIGERILRQAAEPDEDRLSITQARIRYLAEIIALRRAPLAQAREALVQAREALTQTHSPGTLSFEDDLDGLALSDEKFDALEQAVTTYQEAYRATYEQCEHSENLSS
jgi:predicted  nucleic acid-binding Zn-ribbon protein